MNSMRIATASFDKKTEEQNIKNAIKRDEYNLLAYPVPEEFRTEGQQLSYMNGVKEELIKNKIRARDIALLPPHSPTHIKIKFFDEPTAYTVLQASVANIFDDKGAVTGTRQAFPRIDASAGMSTFKFKIKNVPQTMTPSDLEAALRSNLGLKPAAVLKIIAVNASKTRFDGTAIAPGNCDRETWNLLKDAPLHNFDFGGGDCFLAPSVEADFTASTAATASSSATHIKHAEERIKDFLPHALNARAPTTEKRALSAVKISSVLCAQETTRPMTRIADSGLRIGPLPSSD
eukprot:CAMPEP_0206372592 /NCGR_PEP_ID=MMETSP0294-20121207/7203_1 /ASSEMBLY_ACC=CAM_ASM_000327 /TAXON_ID=39354 /ORGANISM="Heterosigma akashiwo, Strain CCMP2393" /LENGTH=289 /DNA_ID=CAMNT_0053820005 /DNA_START=276 /DNA_END=1146 /DNA_ORIENTATION=+